MELSKLVGELPYRRTDVVFYQFFNCLLNDQFYPQIVHNHRKLFLDLLIKLEKRYYKYTLVERIKKMVGMRVKLHPFKRALISSIMIHEGFRVRFFSKQDEVKKLRDVKEKILVSNKKGEILIVAELHKARAKHTDTKIDEKRQITDILRILDVFIWDNDVIGYTEIHKFLKELGTLRWRNPDSISLF